MHESYQIFRPMVIFGAIISLIQGLVWMGMSIMGIVTYYCTLDLTGTVASMSSITKLTYLHMYFKGSCTQGLPEIDFQVLDNLNIMTSDDVFSWLWVYMVISFLWILSSISLLTKVNQSNISNANLFLSFWIMTAITLSAIDLALATIFGIDLDKITFRANQLHLVPELYPHYIIISAQISAAIMLIITVRGFILLIINLSMAIYFFREMLKISSYNKFGRVSGNFPTRNYAATTKPIDAYEKRNPHESLWISSTESTPIEKPTVETTPVKAIQFESIPRPKRNYNNNLRALFDERKRTDETFSQQPLSVFNKRVMKPWETQYHDQRRENAASVAREINQRQNTIQANGNDSTNDGGKNNSLYIPEPDYYTLSIPHISTIDSNKKSATDYQSNEKQGFHSSRF